MALESYQEKVRALRIEADAALDVLEQGLDSERCFIAWSGDTPVGLIGIVERSGRALRFPFSGIRRHFGPVRSLFYFLLLHVGTRRKPPRGGLMFETLFVSPESRRQGIGTLLIDRVEAYAREKGYSSVSLDVTDKNQPAIRLYAGMGYEVVRTARYGFLTRRAGFTGSVRMRKEISRA